MRVGGLPFPIVACGVLLASCATVAPPACSDPDVLAYVAARYSDASGSATLLPATVAQYPTQSRDVVQCTVYVQLTVYDAARYGGLPSLVLEPRFFTLTTLVQGYRVTFPDRDRRTE